MTSDVGASPFAVLDQGVSLRVVLVRLPAEIASEHAATVDAALLLAALPHDALGVFAVIALYSGPRKLDR